MATYSESWLKLEKALGSRPVLHGNAEELRAQFSGLTSALASSYPAPNDAVSTRDGDLGGLRYRVYSPRADENDNILPIGVYYPPGGFVLPASESDDALCRVIAERSRAVLVSIQYRLSPEYQSPIHLQDAVAGFELVSKMSAQLRGDVNRMFVVGSSAGAGLAACVTRKVRKGQTTLPRDAIKGLVALSPYCLHPDNIPSAHQQAHTSYQDNADNVPVVDGTSMRQFFGIAGIDPEDVDYFIGLDPCLYRCFPPTYVVTCENDPLRDDGKLLGESLKLSNVSVRTDHYRGLPHCFWIFTSLPETELFTKNTVKGVDWVVSQM